nr:cysteine-rich RLK (receptor-like protein kinase) 8 [Tanacetum cinerariifolium]
MPTPFITPSLHHRSIVLPPPPLLHRSTVIAPSLYRHCSTALSFYHHRSTAPPPTVLRYIKLSPGQGLFFPRFNPLNLQAYCDSDWATCPTTRRPVTEAEYRGLADCSCEITLLNSLLQDFHIPITSPVKVFCDNSSAIALASNPVQHDRTKHIEIDCHLVRDKIKDGQILPIYIPTTAQIADLLTKALRTPLFNNCLSKLVTDQISNNLSFINSTLALWLELQDHYSQLDGHRIYQLSNDIAQLKQLNFLVEVFYQKMKGYWDEIDALEATYKCTCDCICENGRLNGARENKKRLIQLLIGLDESFANLRGQILLMQPLPIAIKAYGMLRQEKKQREKNKTYSDTGNHWGDLNTRRSTFRQRIICGNCQKEGHYKNECYQIIGYPIGHPLHGKVRPNSNNRALTTRPRAVNMVVRSDVALTSGRETHEDAVVLPRWTISRIN